MSDPEHEEAAERVIVKLLREMAKMDAEHKAVRLACQALAQEMRLHAALTEDGQPLMPHFVRAWADRLEQL